jgi:hypothetical protein
MIFEEIEETTPATATEDSEEETAPEGETTEDDAEDAPVVEDESAE